MQPPSTKQGEPMHKIVAAAAGLAIAAVPAGVVTAEAIAAPAPRVAHSTSVTWPVIRPGSRGEQVRVIQGLLDQRGAKVSVDGTFGTATKNAVIAFQRKVKLTADGIVGAATWKKLILTLKKGSRGSAVSALQ